MDRSMTSFGVIIPARYGSSRFPGKPLALLEGKPMIQWVTEAAARCGADFALVATDDSRIEAAVRQFGGDVVMTRQDHISGTDRLAEAASKRGLCDDTIVVNLQGDEPLLPPEHVRVVAEALSGQPRAALSTLATPITTSTDVFDPNVVKVVLNQHGLAQAFSRAPLPWVRDSFARTGPMASLPPGVPFLRHIGLYAYRVGTLKHLSQAPAVPWEKAESLEQLRALWLGLSIHVTVVAQAPPHGIDTPADLEHAARLLRRDT